MAVEIPLKLKYRCSKASKKCHGDQFGHAQKKRTHAPLTEREKELNARQPLMVLHLLANGKKRMERA